MSLVLHFHPLSSYCWKVLIALDELALPFDKQMVNLGDAASKAAFEALWPTAKIPLLVDAGRVVPETSIIIEYLNRQYPGEVDLLPGDAEQQLQVRLWDRLFDGYVMTPMQHYVAQLLRPEPERDALAMQAAIDHLKNAYRLIETRLGGCRWAAGESFSMADCAAAPALFYAAIIQPFDDSQVVLKAYFERLLSRPSVQRAIVGAQPYFLYFPLQAAIPARFLSIRPTQ